MEQLYNCVAITATLARMIPSARPHPLFAALLCLALLMVRVGGSHLHLCFDGTEPPASYHVVDVDPHHESPGANVAHQDADVAVSADMYSKPSKTGITYPRADDGDLCVRTHQRTTQFRSTILHAGTASRAGTTASPLRGPPLLASL